MMGYLLGLQAEHKRAYENHTRPQLKAPEHAALQAFRPVASSSTSAGGGFHFALDRVAEDSLRGLDDGQLETLWNATIAGALTCPPEVNFFSSAAGVTHKEVFRRWVTAAADEPRGQQRQKLADVWLAKLEKFAYRPISNKLFFALDDHTEILFRKPDAVLRSKNPEMLRRRGDMGSDSIFSVNAALRDSGAKPVDRDQVDLAYQAMQSMKLGDPRLVTPEHFDAVRNMGKHLRAQLRRMDEKDAK